MPREKRKNIHQVFERNIKFNTALSLDLAFRCSLTVVTGQLEYVPWLAKGLDSLALFIPAVPQLWAVLPKQQQQINKQRKTLPRKLWGWHVFVSERATFASGSLSLQMDHVRHRETPTCSRPHGISAAELRPAPGHSDSSWRFSTTCCLLSSCQQDKNSYTVKYRSRYACQWMFMVYFSEFMSIV